MAEIILALSVVRAVLIGAAVYFAFVSLVG